MDLSSPTTQAMIGGVIRSILVAVGGGAIMSGNQLGVVAGAVAALIGVGWSIYQKKSSAKAACVDKHAAIDYTAAATAAAPENATAIAAVAKSGKF